MSPISMRLHVYLAVVLPGELCLNCAQAIASLLCALDANDVHECRNGRMDAEIDRIDFRNKV